MRRSHSTVFARVATAIAVLGLVLLGTGCQTLNYYSHAALGQLRVLTGRQPVDRVLTRLDAQRASDPRAELIYQRLVFSQQVLDFAEHELALAPGDRYRTYVDLNRNAVVWNVFAAPELSLTPYRWCYPVVGCAPYRGYFDKDYAERDARRLERQGYETFVGGVAAYSTLGWFSDPLMSSFVTWPEPDLASLLFHELAHGQAWVPGDVAFNESFATFVGRQGLTVWLNARGEVDVELEWLAALSERRRLLDLLAQTRRALRQVYSSRFDDEVKRRLKADVLAATMQCYVDQRDRLGDGRFDGLMAGLNNARLVSVSTYEDMVPGFARLFEAVGGSWSAFFERVRALTELSAGERRAALLEGLEPAAGQQLVAQHGESGRVGDIQCESLSGRLFDADFAGRRDERAGNGDTGV